jgi:hypothetical protein
MRRDLIRRLVALETSARSSGPGKAMLPAWLIESLVEQGARLDARGDLDLTWLREHGQSGGVPCIAN